MNTEIGPSIPKISWPEKVTNYSIDRISHLIREGESLATSVARTIIWENGRLLQQDGPPRVPSDSDILRQIFSYPAYELLRTVEFIKNGRVLPPSDVPNFQKDNSTDEEQAVSEAEETVRLAYLARVLKEKGPRGLVNHTAKILIKALIDQELIDVAGKGRKRFHQLYTAYQEASRKK